MEIEDIRRIELKPGDRFVVRTKVPVSYETHAKLTAAFEQFAPGVPVLVLGPEMSLEILSGSGA